MESLVYKWCIVIILRISASSMILGAHVMVQGHNLWYYYSKKSLQWLMHHVHDP